MDLLKRGIMDLLKKVLMKIIQPQKGFASIVVAISIVVAFAVGIGYKHFSKSIDSPAEQIAEQVLDAAGIDIDFSEDKKKLT